MKIDRKKSSLYFTTKAFVKVIVFFLLETKLSLCEIVIVITATEKKFTIKYRLSTITLNDREKKTGIVCLFHQKKRKILHG